MTLRKRPEKLEFNQAEVPSGFLEYKWAVRFDVNADETKDYEVAASHFRTDVGRVMLPLVEGTQNDLWKLEMGRGKKLAEASARISGNDLVLEVPRAAAEDLKSVTAATEMIFTTAFYDGRMALLKSRITGDCSYRSRERWW
jgi:hypothetical protein